MSDIDLHRHLIGQQGSRRSLNTPALVIDRDALDREMAPVFAAWPVEEAAARLAAAGLAWGRVSTVADLSAHPALRRVTCQVPGGTFALAAPPLLPDAFTDDRARYGKGAVLSRRRAALAAVLLYRISTFYLPPVWGFFAMRWLQRNRFL